MTEPVYSAKQEQGGTAVGAYGAMQSPSMPATPDVAGSVGPPAQSAYPWPGRHEAQAAAFDASALTFANLAAQAQNAPGNVATTAVTGGAPNTAPEPACEAY